MIEQGGELNDLWFHWTGDDEGWDFYYEIGSGSGSTRAIKDGEQVTVRRIGNSYVVTRDE